MRLLLVGMNHRTAPVSFRERFAVQDPAALLPRLLALEEVQEAVILSTCNRVEVTVVVQKEHVDKAARWLREEFFVSLAGEEPLEREGPMGSICYEYQGREVTQHLFRVSSSLDSLIVGEPQILGQVKEAYRIAQEVNATGQVLNRLFERAFVTAKRVRRETQIAEGAVSVARVAVSLGKQIFEHFEGKSALLIGAGEMIEAAIKALQVEGLASIKIANRTLSRAEHLAAEFGASAHRLTELPELLVGTDVVLICIGGDGILLDKASMGAAMKRRRDRPLFVIDIGVPRNVADAVNELEGVYLYDLDDLSEAAASNAQQRQRATLLAEELVLEEEREFDNWMSSLQVVPMIRELCASADLIRETEQEKAFRKLDLSEEQRKAVEGLTRSIVNKLLHAPLVRLREPGTVEDRAANVDAARKIFGLQRAERAEKQPSDSRSKDRERAE